MQNLKVRLGSKRTDEICQLGLSGNLSQATEILLTEYYDPMYDGHIKRNAPYEITVSGDDVSQAASELLRFAGQKAVQL